MKNHFIHQDRPTKPVPVAQIVLIMVIIFLLLVVADYIGLIKVTNTQGL